MYNNNNNNKIIIIIIIIIIILNAFRTTQILPTTLAENEERNQKPFHTHAVHNSP